MSDQLAAQIMRRKDALATLRSPHEQVWRDCFDYSFPERGDGFNNETSNASTLQAKRARLLDSTSTDAGQILASAVMGGGTPSNSRWFGMSTGQDSDEEKRWFDTCSEIIFQNIHGSNYDAVGFECALDIVAAGWFVLYIDVDREKGGYHFEEWPLSTCWIASSKPGGLADTLVRTYELTVEQAVNTFGAGSGQGEMFGPRGGTSVHDPFSSASKGVSEKVLQLFNDGKLDEKVKFCQSIYPRGAAGLRAKNMPFASCHIEVDSKKTVRESGYHECPFVAPRWAKLPNSDYAIGPMFRALPDTKQLNRLVYLEDTNADMAISGMWIAEDDGVLNPRTVKVGPRKIIVANSVDSMKPLKSGADFQLSFTKKEQLQAAIRKILMADQLSPQDGPVRTAYETHVRVQMIRQLLGPIYGRLQAEWYAPMIARCFGLAYRAGILPPAPQTLAEKSFNVVFISPMAKAQKLEEVTAIEASIASVAQMATAKQDPEIWDYVDVEDSVRRIFDGRGAPASTLRDSEEVQAMRESRRQARQQAAQQQQSQEMAMPMMQQMAKNMATA